MYREVTQQLPGGVHIIFGQSITAQEEAQCTDVPRPTSVIRGEMGASGERHLTVSSCTARHHTHAPAAHCAVCSPPQQSMRAQWEKGPSLLVSYSARWVHQAGGG